MNSFDDVVSFQFKYRNWLFFFQWVWNVLHLILFCFYLFPFFCMFLFIIYYIISFVCFLSSWFCVVCCLHFLFTYFKIYIVFKKFNLGCCPNYSKVLLRTHGFCMMVQKSNCILLTGIPEYGGFESMWCWGNFWPSSAFSSSRRFRQAAFGFRLRSVMGKQHLFRFDGHESW